MINKFTYSVSDTQVSTVVSIRNVPERFTNNTRSKNKGMRRHPVESEKTTVCYNNGMSDHA